MTQSTEILAKPNYASWIVSSDAFKKIKEIRKVFPHIGLPNFTETTFTDNFDQIKPHAINLLRVIAANLQQRVVKLEKFEQTAKLGKERRRELQNLKKCIDELCVDIAKDATQFIVKLESGKITLNIPKTYSISEKHTYKQGMGIFKIYADITDFLIKNKCLGLPALENNDYFKIFSNINLPGAKLNLVFSSEGIEGAWDIATMSMRGVSSCQTWYNGGGNDAKVIGSMIDPFTAIMYLTNDTPCGVYGSKMLRRSIVRYGFYYDDKGTKQPFILLDRMYPSYDENTAKLFINTIKKRIPGIHVQVYIADSGRTQAATVANSWLALHRAYIPLSDELNLLDLGKRPYSDSAIPYLKDATCALSQPPIKVQKLNAKDWARMVTTSISSASFRKKDLKEFDLNSKIFIGNLRGRPYSNQALCSFRKRIADRKLLENFEQSHIQRIDAKKKFNTVRAKFAEYICKKDHKLDKEANTFLRDEIRKIGLEEKFSAYMADNIIKYCQQQIVG